MNNALAMLALGQMQSAKESAKLAAYSIELPNGEVVTLDDLTNFWIEGHKKIQKALEIIKESKACNTTGENTSTQSQNTGKKSRKSTKKTTTSQK